MALESVCVVLCFLYFRIYHYILLFPLLQKLLHTNDWRPFTRNTWNQESEQCKTKLCSMPLGADVRWGMKKQHWLRICFAINHWYTRSAWFDWRKDDQYITFQAFYLPADRAAYLASGLQNIWELLNLQSIIQWTGVLGVCCVLVLFCHHCYSEENH